jgi:hypothetical protein
MRWVTVRAAVACGHQGRVVNVASQHWLRITGEPVLVAEDPVGRTVVGCPNYGPTIAPCTTTLAVLTGYSDWVSVGGRAVVLSHLDGLTDGTVPGTVHYTVTSAGQRFVEADR